MRYVHTAANTNQIAFTVSPRTTASMTHAMPPSREIAAHRAIFCGVQRVRACAPGSSSGTAVGGRDGSGTISGSSSAAFRAARVSVVIEPLQGRVVAVRPRKARNRGGP
ncbi:Uncharacterised protein [Mycobacteroides abscessus]|nr:Uncharacterised protein [Mycobacteroides abscessus]